MEESLICAILTHDRERSLECFGGNSRQLPDVLDLRSIGSGNDGSLEQLQRGRIARGSDLDISIGSILHPTGQPQLARFFNHEPPEPNALNAAADFEVDRLHSGLASYSEKGSQLRGDGRRVSELARRGRGEIAISDSPSDVVQSARNCLCC
jgi:hypothetical protein